jgi:hypothetical protein
MQFDETQPYGRVAGPPLPGMDRPAAFEQGGRFFDANKRLLVPNTPLDPAEVAADAEREREDAEAKELAEAEANMLAQRKAEADRRARERAKTVENRAKAISPSRIMPAWQPPDFDRAAHYQIGDKYLDEHGREIMPNQPMSTEALAAAKAVEEDMEGLLVSELIAQAHSLSFNALLAAARGVLGPTCPRSLEQVVEKLRLLVKRDPSLRVPRIRAAG